MAAPMRLPEVGAATDSASSDPVRREAPRAAASGIYAMTRSAAAAGAKSFSPLVSPEMARCTNQSRLAL